MEITNERLLQDTKELLRIKINNSDELLKLHKEELKKAPCQDLNFYLWKIEIEATHKGFLECQLQTLSNEFNLGETNE